MAELSSAVAIRPNPMIEEIRARMGRPQQRQLNAGYPGYDAKQLYRRFGFGGFRGDGYDDPYGFRQLLEMMSLPSGRSSYNDPAAMARTFWGNSDPRMVGAIDRFYADRRARGQTSLADPVVTSGSSGTVAGGSTAGGGSNPADLVKTAKDIITPENRDKLLVAGDTSDRAKFVEEILQAKTQYANNDSAIMQAISAIIVKYGTAKADEWLKDANLRISGNASVGATLSPSEAAAYRTGFLAQYSANIKGNRLTPEVNVGGQEIMSELNWGGISLTPAILEDIQTLLSKSSLTGDEIARLETEYGFPRTKIDELLQAQNSEKKLLILRMFRTLRDNFDTIAKLHDDWGDDSEINGYDLEKLKDSMNNDGLKMQFN